MSQCGDTSSQVSNATIIGWNVSNRFDRHLQSSDPGNLDLPHVLTVCNLSSVIFIQQSGELSGMSISRHGGMGIGKKAKGRQRQA